MPLCADAKPVKIFILAGQSNMEGKAPNVLFDHQAAAEGTKDIFAHLREAGGWVKRDDVQIKFLERAGSLTIGYGSPGRTGVEFEFGAMMGDYFEEPVVLIKAAWGGHSLARQFRPPSAGFPEELMQKELQALQQKVARENEVQAKSDPQPTIEDVRKDYGVSYRAMMEEVRRVQENVGAIFPTLQGRDTVCAGLVWFQGWNDQYGTENEYASNLVHFIKDVRRDLKTPDLACVIAAMGQNGSKPAEGAMLTIREAQLSMNEVPEFRGNVKAFRTDLLVDKAAEAMYPQWKENKAWSVTGGDHPYHYLGSAIWFTRIGHAMGESMLELLTTRKQSRTRRADAQSAGEAAGAPAAEGPRREERR